MDNTSFAQRLNIALDKANFPEKGKGRQTTLAQRLDVSSESVRKWLEGVGFPDTKRIPEIAKLLGVNKVWLLYGIGDINPSTIIKDLPSDTSPNWIKVPVLSWEEAGAWDKIVPEAKASSHYEQAWAETQIGPNSYALRVQDDSMMPRYEPGSLLIVDPNYIPTHKHIVIYLQAMASTVVCKQLIIEGKNKYLSPHNPNYPIISLSEDDKYCGSIRQARMNYDESLLRKDK